MAGSHRREKIETDMFAALKFPEFSPFVFSIGGLPLRWYAVSYILGLILSFSYANQLVKRPHLYGLPKSPVSKEDMDDIFTWSLVGIILGGRLGYLLFYTLSTASGRAAVAEDPMSLLRIWDGGLSFHGGFIGVCVVILIVSRIRKVPLLAFADMGAMIAPISIFSVRILGNFMNAELYGRHTDSAVGMVFPEGIATNYTGPPAAWDAVEKVWIYAGTEMPRHPSQIYEGVLEGLLPTLILGLLAFRFGLLKKQGLAAGLFFILYGIGRSISELFREPDQHIDFLPEWITMGQILSIPMWLAGVFLIWYSLREKPLSAMDK